MELVGNLKNQVNQTKSLEEAKGIIENAGMKLTDDELDMVTGGAGFLHPAPKQMRDWNESETFGDRKISGLPAAREALPKSVVIHNPYK